MGRKLDLSKLTDEEARHVWEVVQRDFDLRKKEEARLEELKGKIEKESTKRELLSDQAHLSETHCVHCLQPYKFLINSKRQCLVCHLHTCKHCCSFTQPEGGWVCDPCQLARVLKIGSLEWYYQHVQSRFKRFGSAKVMHSLYGRLQHGSKTNSTFLGLSNKVYSLPELNSEPLFLPGEGNDENKGTDEESGLNEAEALRHSQTHKKRRLLSIQPFDFEVDADDSTGSPCQSLQLSSTPVILDAQQSPSGFPSSDEEDARSMMAETDIASVFHHTLEERDQHHSPQEQESSTEVCLPTDSGRESLEGAPQSGRFPGLDYFEACQGLPHEAGQTLSTPKMWTKNQGKGDTESEQHQSQYLADMDTSDEELERGLKMAAYQFPHSKHRGRTSSQESKSYSGSQIFELSKRMSAIEHMLNRLEEKIWVHSQEDPALGSHSEADLEEETLRRKLGELTSHIPDREPSSEEEEEGKERWKEPVLSSSSDNQSQRAPKVCRAPDQAYELEKSFQCSKYPSQLHGTPDSELSELEDKVALAAVEVQNTESEIFPFQPAKNPDCSSQDPTLEPSNESKAMSVPHPGRKFNTSLKIQGSSDDSFDRKSVYRGSLTQRNPNGKKRKMDRLFAKPVMTHRS
ncbi:melanophilin isoform X2 [Tachyglossus aculeatus]|uniref:melanophilin isoform X2 n=1 Tax=Tachyglossus aculeatus TaxID=9261 RepID=UPI0018F4056D|nr:melanophilin isoform X2 [Tachyglossus aculeatus]